MKRGRPSTSSYTSSSSSTNQINLPKWLIYHPHTGSHTDTRTSTTTISTSNASSISNASTTTKRTTRSSTSPTKTKNPSVITDIKNEHKVQTQKEELLLRTKAYHHSSTEIIQKAFDQTLHHYLNSSVLFPLCDFMIQFQPDYEYDDDDDDSSSSSSQCGSENDEYENIQEKPSKRCKLNHNKEMTNDIALSSVKPSSDVLSMSLMKEKLRQQIYQSMSISNHYNYSADNERSKTSKTTTITSKKYHPTLLPIGIIHVQPSVLDRNIIIKALQSQLIHNQSYANTNKNANKNVNALYNPTVCIISEKDHTNTNMNTDSRTNYGSFYRRYNNSQVEYYLSMVLTQCIQQESNPNQYSHLLRSTSSSSTTSKVIPATITEKIILWAQNTTQYNSILIIIENPELIPNHIFNTFLSIISTLRSVHGVPVSLVFFSISKELVQKDLLSTNVNLSSLNGEVGIVIHEFYSVKSRVLVDGLLETLYNHKDLSLNLPVILSNHVMMTLLHEFEYSHGSVVTFMNQLKMILAHHFTTKGTSIALMNNKSFMDKYGLHLTWFCVDSNARKRMLNLSRYQKLQVVRNNGERSDDDITHSEKIMDISFFFDQSVVLIDKVSEDGVEWDLREWMVEELCKILCGQSFQGHNKTQLSSIVFLGNNEQTMSCTSSIHTQPRRDLALAITRSDANRGNNGDAFTCDVKVAFSVFDSRLIPAEEWFRRFTESLPREKKRGVDTANLVHRFAFCLYQLMFCGLVIRSSRNENVFEKTALVWASTTASDK